MGTVVTYAGLVAVGIAYATLVAIGRSSVTDSTSVSFIGMVVLTFWLAVASVVTYMYSWSWEVGL